METDKTCGTLWADGQKSCTSEDVQRASGRNGEIWLSVKVEEMPSLRTCSFLHGRLSGDARVGTAVGGGEVSLRVSVFRRSKVMQMVRQTEGKAE